MKDDLFWLMLWFASQCDGDWEHSYAIILETEYPAEWSLTINLSQTELENQHFDKIHTKFNDHNWVECSVQDNKFIGKCSAVKVLDMIHTFRNWVELLTKLKFNPPQNIVNDDSLVWLSNWYFECCKRGLNSKDRIMISTIDNPGWDLQIDLRDTGLDEKKIPYVKVERTDDDWYHCFIKESTFNGPCGLYNFFEALGVFKKLAELSSII